MYSVVIPTHNRKENLFRALRSVEAQTLPPDEIIVVDDHSAESLDRAEFADLSGEVQYVYLRRNHGAAYARNIGIELATSPYIAFLDDDDEWLPSKMNKQVKYLESHPECVLVSCWAYNELNERRYLPSPDQRYAEEYFWYQNVFGPQKFTVRSHPPQKFDEEFPALQDWEYVARLRKKGNLHILPEGLCIVHLTTGGRITGARRKKRRALELFLKKFSNQMPNKAKQLLRARLAFIEAELTSDPAAKLRHLIRANQKWLRNSPVPWGKWFTSTIGKNLEALIGKDRASAWKCHLGNWLPNYRSSLPND